MATTAAPAGAADAADVTCRGKVATIVGTQGDDVLIGTPGRDIIAGLGGDDVIKGLGGRDLICGGRGADRVKGNQGRDRLYGNAGPDKLFGGKGPDRLFGGVSDDLLRGQAGNDALDGGPGTDTCYQDQGTGPKTSCELPPAPIAPKPEAPKPPELTGLAIAYSDLNGNDTFDSGDVLISKLVDSNLDDVPSAGDTIVMGQYPLDFDASAFGDWGVASHEVTSVAGLESHYVVLVSAAGTHTFWHLAGDAELYLEDPDFTLFQDGYTASRPDVITIPAVGPSEPTDPINVDRTHTSDDDFINVELDYVVP